ncbi:hypothetical protein ACFOY2_11215 [Nonomuraea purpurea]|uniref:Uncharacterized protein n=2 Tax=Nonomuraea purpurea TaxID=1849276 RepID=A0ABV8G3P0_9ACTN
MSRLTARSATCDEQAAGVALSHRDVRERLSEAVGERPGEWAIGIYDRPSAGTAAPSGAVERGQTTP